MNKVPTLAVVLVAIGLGSLLIGLAYTTTYYRPNQNNSWGEQYGPGGMGQWNGMMGQWNRQLSAQPQSGSTTTMDQAKAIAEQYLASLGNSNLGIKEIMEFQYNFYIIYYEKDTGRGAFEMLIWKQAPPSGYGVGGGMMGGWTGVVMPEPGPNMMWNTKYSPMANGMMGYGQGYGNGNQASSTMTVSMSQAEQDAQSYLTANYHNSTTQMATEFYGYYTFDYTLNGQTAGMLSVNGYTGQVWLHTWHGDFIQEVEFT